MTTHHEHWTCDICRERYDTPEEAQACEDQGPPVVPPPGTIVVDGFYLHDLYLLQVVAAPKAPNPGPLNRRPSRSWHSLTLATWTWRDVGEPAEPWLLQDGTNRDSTPAKGERASTQVEATPVPCRPGCRSLPATVPVDRSSPRYRRAWDDMKAAGLPLYFWVDGAVTPALPPMDNPVEVAENGPVAKHDLQAT